MPARGRVRPRRPWLAAAGAAIVAVAVCLVLALRPGAAAPPVSEPAAAAPPASPGALVLPEHPRVLVFGDSWVYGSAAIEPTLGFAYVAGADLGWDVVVDGVRGSGYLKPGIDGPAYGERIAALDPALDPDLVIVEGSINDRRLYPDGYRDAVTAAWDALAALYPDAHFVVLGPAPQVLPVQKATARIDADLAQLAAERGWWHVSPIDDAWITADNYAQVIDATEVGRDHPSTAGHAYLAERLAGALRELALDQPAAADAPLEHDLLP